VYFLLGRFLAKEVVGLVQFATVTTAQVGVLLSYSFQDVLFPALVHVKIGRARLRDALLRALSAIMLVGTAASLGLAVVMEPLERFLWHGKWASAVPAIQGFGVFSRSA